MLFFPSLFKNSYHVSVSLEIVFMLSDASTFLLQQPWWSACWIILPWERWMGVIGPRVLSSRGKSFLTLCVVWLLSGLPRKGLPGPWCVPTHTRSEVPMTRMGCVGEGVWKGYSKVPPSPVMLGWEFQAPWKESIHEACSKLVVNPAVGWPLGSYWGLWGEEFLYPQGRQT